MKQDARFITVGSSRFKVIALFLFLCAYKISSAQLQVSVDTLKITAVQGIYISKFDIDFTVTDKNGGNISWNSFFVAPPTALWVHSLDNATGTTPCKRKFTPWPQYFVNHAIGKSYTALVIYQPGLSDSVTIPIELTVIAPASKINYSYLSGPNFCHSVAPTSIYDLPLPDSAVCTVPDEYPATSFTPPPVGGSYIDPNFGAKVTVLADSNHVNTYSSACAISPHNKYVYMISIFGDARIADANTGAVLQPHAPYKGVRWDNRNDSILYYLDTTSVYMYNWITAKHTKLLDYSNPPYNFTKITQGGYGDYSKDNWMAFLAVEQNMVCALDLNTLTTYTADYTLTQSSLPYDMSKPTAFISKGADSQSGLRYVVIFSASAAPFGLFSINTATKKLDFICRGPESPNYIPGKVANLNNVCEPGEDCTWGIHPDFFEGPDGIQYMASADGISYPCELNLVTLQLNKGVNMRMPVELGGGMRKVMTIHKCGTPWGSSHVGASKSAPFFTLSIEYPSAVDPSDKTTPLQRGQHASEVIAIKALSGGNYEVRRLMEHRSVGFNNDAGYLFWSQPRACISNDGSRIICTSDFGIPNLGQNQQGTHVLSVETGYPEGLAIAVNNLDPKKDLVRIYPNPTEGIFEMAMDATSNIVDVQIINVHGQLLFSDKIQSKNERIVKHFDMSSFAKGMYFLKISSVDFNRTEKLVVR